MKIEMELLSDAIPGSGEGIAGIIDGDITYNEFGIPHIPAKRIKGILRESARDLQDAGLLNADQIDRIFGVSGQEKGTELKLADGHVPDYENLRDFLKTITRGATYKKLASLFNQEAVLDYYCYTRSQTTINKNGVAQKDSLRTFRILKKKLKFYFNVVCPDGCEEDLENILKVTRAFGTSRTRGTGEIKLQIRDKESPDYSTEDVPAAEDRFIDSDLCTGCGSCVTACPAEVFAVVADEFSLDDEEVAIVAEAQRNKLKYVCAPCKPVGERPSLPCVAACRPGAAIEHSW